MASGAESDHLYFCGLYVWLSRYFTVSWAEPVIALAIYGTLQVGLVFISIGLVHFRLCF